MLITFDGPFDKNKLWDPCNRGYPISFFVVPFQSRSFLKFLLPTSALGTNPGSDQKYHDLLINFRGVFCFHQIVFWRRIIDRNSKHLCSDLDHF